jgi:hypothetical protein
VLLHSFALAVELKEQRKQNRWNCAASRRIFPVLVET